MARITVHTIEDAPAAGRPLLAEAFACLALAVFTSRFLNCAVTELDVPAGPAQPGEGG